MTVLSQRSFTGGELSPAAAARADLAKYQTGLARLRNFFVMKHGGFTNRAGTEMCAEVSDSSKTIRKIDFVFSVDQSYVLEFGNLYMRVLKNGRLVSTVHGTNVTGISAAANAVVTHVAHGYATGAEILLAGITGNMRFYNGQTFTVEVLTANTYKIKLRGVYLDTTGLTFAGTVLAYKIFKITTPYLEADLPTLHYVQSADVMTLTHPNYPIYDLSRITETNWTLVQSEFKSSILAPAASAVSAGGAGAITYEYYVTAVRRDTYEESLPSVGTGVAKNIVDIVQGTYLGNSILLTFQVTAHGYSVGNVVLAKDVAVSSMYQVNNRVYRIIAVPSVDTFIVSIPITPSYPTYITSPASGTVTKLTLSVVSAVPTDAAPNLITWNKVEDAVEYNVYRAINGVYGYLGTSQNLLFRDIGLTPDITQTPPVDKGVFLGAQNYPSTVTYFQQRKMFASTLFEPEKAWGSKTGQYYNFTFSHPLQDDDAIEFNLSGRRVNRIKHMLDLQQLVLLTSEGEFGVTAEGGITPSNIPLKQYSYNGCSDLAPIIVDNSALYVQARGSIVRDLAFEFESNGYRGNDLTVFSSHLFEGHTIVAWAYQKTPHSIVWAVRDDGILLGCTYIKEQQLLAWHRHDLQDGLVEDICVIPEGENDSVYMTVNRTIDGETRRYIERMSVRNFTDIAVDCTILDSFVTYDGRNDDDTHTMQLTSAGGWTTADTLSLTSSASFFDVINDIGNEIHLKDADGNIVRLEILDDLGNSPTSVVVRADRTVIASFRNALLSTWSRAVDTVEGLWHLEGERVSIFADGFVVANPNNKDYVVNTVSSGIATLDACYAVIHIGKPLTSDFETLDVEFTNAESMVGKKILINRVNLKVLESRGVFVGSKKPTDAEELSAATFLKNLSEAKIRQYEGYDSPIALKTGEFNINILAEWKSSGRIFGRNTDPIPLTILSIHPEGNIPVRGAQ